MNAIGIAYVTELHALAICAWARTNQTEDPAVIASRVTTARECSNRAIAATTASRAASALVDQIDAACTDAEAEHAIQAHAEMVQLLVNPDPYGDSLGDTEGQGSGRNSGEEDE